MNREEKELTISITCEKCNKEDNSKFEYLFYSEYLFLEFICRNCDAVFNFKTYKNDIRIENNAMLKKMVNAVEKDNK